MKPFNLEEALAGKPLVARNGRQFKNFRHGDTYFEAETSDTNVTFWFNSDGTAIGEADFLDLFMEEDENIVVSEILSETQIVEGPTILNDDKPKGETGPVEVPYEYTDSPKKEPDPKKLEKINSAIKAKVDGGFLWFGDIKPNPYLSVDHSFEEDFTFVTYENGLVICFSHRTPGAMGYSNKGKGDAIRDTVVAEIAIQRAKGIE